MIQILELADKDGQVAIIIMLNKVKENRLSINKEQESQVRNRNYILKEAMEILELKNTIFEIKNSLDGLDKTDSKNLLRSIENFQSEEQKKKLKNRNSLRDL